MCRLANLRSKKILNFIYSRQKKISIETAGATALALAHREEEAKSKEEEVGMSDEMKDEESRPPPRIPAQQ